MIFNLVFRNTTHTRDTDGKHPVIVFNIQEDYVIYIENDEKTLIDHPSFSGGMSMYDFKCAYESGRIKEVTITDHSC